jgi:hypothetical protein
MTQKVKKQRFHLLNSGSKTGSGLRHPDPDPDLIKFSAKFFLKIFMVGIL